MDHDNSEKIHCADDNEYKIYWDICDKLRVDRNCNNHLKSGTHKNINRKKTTNR